MSTAWLSRFDGLTTWANGNERAPHKPLLILLALGELSRGNATVRFADAVEPLTELLRRFGPARKAYHPEYPFWRLQRDGVWEVVGVYEIPISQDGGATRGALLAADACGRFPDEIRNGLTSEPELIGELARRLLRTHFPDSMHEDILDAIGLELADVRASGGGRDPNFRKLVLKAYQQQCAVCGLQLLISGAVVALEAAHIRWHQASGPAVVQNGLCLCVLHHKLFDLGALTLSPTLQVLVSDEISGLRGLEEQLLAHHGKPLRSPLRTEDLPTKDFIDWHQREVFRGSPRPL